MTAMAERGAAKWSVLGFEGANYGNNTSIAMAQLRGCPKLPSFGWPVLSYPTSLES